MTEKHTPGPWHLNGLSVESADCWIASCDSRESNDNDCTNARLIAAAPELLAALCDLLPLADCYARDRKSHGERIDAARAAIAKATGEQS